MLFDEKIQTSGASLDIVVEGAPHIQRLVLNADILGSIPDLETSPACLLPFLSLCLFSF